jgi:ubiquinone/menaquinone biosynthesis C-methylase UbiE
MASERERLLARYYDLEYEGYTQDVDFYVQFAKLLDPERKLPLLELGAGTGRIAIELAGVGYSVVCVDISEAMLEACEEKARARGVEERIRVVRGDMRDLEGVPGGPYNVAYCALNSFTYLASSEDQLAMLASVKKVLVQHGILLLDLTAPFPHLMPPSDGEVVHQGTYPLNNGTVVHKLVSGRGEPSKQMHHVTLVYDRESAGGTLSRVSQKLDIRWTGRYEMEGLLRVAGYELENVYGSYDLDGFGDESERMIFVARV